MASYLLQGILTNFALISFSITRPKRQKYKILFWWLPQTIFYQWQAYPITICYIGILVLNTSNHLTQFPYKSLLEVRTHLKNYKLEFRNSTMPWSSLGLTIVKEFYIIMTKKSSQYLVDLIVVIINDLMPVRARQCVISVCFNYQFSFY